MALKKSQKSLLDWEKEDWGTKSGEPSAKTGERYLPKAARESLSDSQYAATTAKISRHTPGRASRPLRAAMRYSPCPPRR